MQSSSKAFLENYEEWFKSIKDTFNSDRAYIIINVERHDDRIMISKMGGWDLLLYGEEASALRDQGWDIQVKWRANAWERRHI